MKMTEQLFAELSRFNEVEAIALGGSRAGENYDERSDYDVYLYCTAPIPEQARRELLGKYCSYMEIGNHYWEYEDNCTLNNGIDIDILYRNLDDFANGIAEVVEQFQAHNGYTTCMWHNLKTCKIIYDRHGNLEKVKNRFDISYPEELRSNIITQNMNLLNNAMPAYSHQITKAVLRGDRVSVLHRTTAFLESYFDILFAVNWLTHPGEKRLVELCTKNCSILPEHFEENLNRLFDDMGRNVENVHEDVRVIVDDLNKLF